MTFSSTSEGWISIPLNAKSHAKPGSARWFLAMQVVYYQGGRLWLRWQELHIPLVLKQQKVTRKAYGEHVGYWDSSRKEQRFSRICTTALALMILESGPPRCLPVFHHQPDEQVIQPGFGDEIEVEVNL
jgi:hypothetical protein